MNLNTPRTKYGSGNATNVTKECVADTLVGVNTVQEELKYLHNNISALEDVLVDFSVRLSPVLRLSTPTNDFEEDERPMTEIEHEVYTARRRIQGIIQGVESLVVRTAL